MIGSLKKTKTLSYRRNSWWTGSLLLLSAGFILFIVICSLFPDQIASHSPTRMDPSDALLAPSLEHLLGTDQFGRDIFSLIVHGSQQSLVIGVLSVLIGGGIGGLIGLVSGYCNNAVDNTFMRIMDIIMTIPGIMLAILVSAVLGPSTLNLILAVSIASLPGYARVMRGQVLHVKDAGYVHASRSIGSGHTGRILFHILPNSLPPMLVMATIGVGNAILMATGLSFLGLGTVHEIPDWGYLLSLGRDYLTVAWWIGFFPGLFISLFVISVNILGDAYRNYLDPRSAMS
nr:ABC transporter permease [Terribacillus saccharophilus]